MPLFILNSLSTFSLIFWKRDVEGFTFFFAIDNYLYFILLFPTDREANMFFPLQ